MVEIEGQLVRSDIGSFLRRLLADDFVQCPMKQVRHGVMSLNCRATDRINGYTHGFTDLGSATVSERTTMDKYIALPLRIGDLQATELRPVGSRHMDQTSVTHLTTHFRITGGAIDDQVEFSAPCRWCDRLDHGFGFKEVIAKELRRSDLKILFRNRNNLSFLCPARASALLLH